MTQPVFRNPNNDDSLTGTFNEVLRNWLQNTDDMLPARVVSYDRATNRALVQPLIQMIDNDGNNITRATQSNLPVLILGAGGFLVSFHLPENSLGWIKANDRDISIFLQSNNSESPPNTFRLHSFEDAIFIPDVMSGYTIDSEDAQAMVIQNTAGTVRLSLNDARIKFTAPLIDIDGPVNINGVTTITGDAEVTGTLTNGSINLTTHTHSQPPDSGGDTEMPTSEPV